MKTILTVLLILLSLSGFTQDYTYLDEVDTKLVAKHGVLKIDFDRIMIANIVLTDIEGEIMDKFTNYKTNKDLKLQMKDYGPGIYYLFIQWNSQVAVKRIRVKRDTVSNYDEQYKLIIR